MIICAKTCLWQLCPEVKDDAGCHRFARYGTLGMKFWKVLPAARAISGIDEEHKPFLAIHVRFLDKKECHY